MRKPISIYLSIVLVITSFSCDVKSETNYQVQEANYDSAIDSARVLVEDLLEKYQTPGVAVSVSIEGELVWSEGFGYADLENEVEVDPYLTMFRIGSVSKTFTSLALGKLYDQNKIDFDNEIQSYVPYFPVKKYPVSVRQVGGHIAGIRHYRGFEFLSDKHYESVRDALTIFENDTLLFEPGTKYSYSSYGWNLISAVIEGAAEMDFLDYMSGIFKDLEMTHTLADMANIEIPNRTKFYMIQNNSIKEAPEVDNSIKWAGGGFISTSEDLIQFGNAQLFDQYISPESFEILSQTQYLSDSSATNYGMGWRSGINEQGTSWLGHSGGSIGGITMFAIYPDEKIVIALCSNSGDHGWDNLHHKLASIFTIEEVSNLRE